MVRLYSYGGSYTFGGERLETVSLRVMAAAASRLLTFTEGEWTNEWTNEQMNGPIAWTNCVDQLRGPIAWTNEWTTEPNG